MKLAETLEDCALRSRKEALENSQSANSSSQSSKSSRKGNIIKYLYPYKYDKVIVNCLLNDEDQKCEPFHSIKVMLMETKNRGLRRKNDEVDHTTGDLESR